jgi:hypothetical protein
VFLKYNIIIINIKKKEKISKIDKDKLKQKSIRAKTKSKLNFN